MQHQCSSVTLADCDTTTKPADLNLKTHSITSKTRLDVSLTAKFLRKDAHLRKKRHSQYLNAAWRRNLITAMQKKLTTIFQGH